MKYILLTLLLITPSQAQDLSLELGRSLDGILDSSSHINYKDGSHSAIISIDLSAGTVVQFHSRADFDNYLSLFSPTMTLLASNDEAGDSDGLDNFESVLVSEIPESGEYKLVVSGYYDYSLGNYDLSAQKIMVVDDSEVSLPAEINGMLNDSDDYNDDGYYYYDAFTLVLEAPAKTTISMTSPIIDSMIQIFDEAGNLIASNDNKEFTDDPSTTDYDESLDYTTDSELNLELAAGRYSVEAMSYNPGFYQLSVTTLGKQPNTPTPSKPKPVGSKPGS